MDHTSFQRNIFFFGLKIIIFFKWRQHLILINVEFFLMVSLMLHWLQAIWYGWQGLLPEYKLSFTAKAFIYITTVIIFSIESNMLYSKYSDVTVCHIKIFLRDVLVGKSLKLQLKSLVAWTCYLLVSIGWNFNWNPWCGSHFRAQWSQPWVNSFRIDYRALHSC